MTKKGKKRKMNEIASNEVTKVWDTTRLRQFIVDEMDARQWDMNKLAEAMKVSHTTVGRFMSGKTNITLAFIEEFSRATSIDIRVLVALIFPELIHAEKPDVIALAELILKLSPEGQRRLKRLIIGLLQDESGGEDGE